MTDPASADNAETYATSIFRLRRFADWPRIYGTNGEMLSLFSRIKAVKLTSDGNNFPKGAQRFQMRRTKLDPAVNV
jgi:hypothetical protein